jgi:hypothetical protein
MKHKYTPSSRRKDWTQITILAALLGFTTLVHAQEGSQGNTTIFGGAQMSFFSNHNFVAGSGGAQPGVILTQRATGTFGILSYSGDNLTSTGVSNTGYVDGYVKKYGSGQFIFPVGDNGNDGQFAASADGTMGAYFHADPSSAVTSNLFTGGSYPALPAGGPFPVASTDLDIKAVSTVEYWDIDGTNPTEITLTWDAGSNVSGLTAGNLSALTIVGWNGSEWVNILATVDATSILAPNGPSTLTSGSITTALPLVPNAYTAYTLGSIGPDVTPRITLSPNISHGTSTLELMITVSEINDLSTDGSRPITVRVLKDRLPLTEWDGTRTLSDNATPVNNNLWVRLADEPNDYIFQSKPGVIIPGGTNIKFVFKVQFNPAGAGGSFPITTSIDATNAGGEVNVLNNNDAEVLTYFPN